MSVKKILCVYNSTLSDCFLFCYSISWKKNEVADGEATTFSIFYNNTLYLFLVLGLFYFLNSFNPLVYPDPPYMCSVVVCGVVALRNLSVFSS